MTLEAGTRLGPYEVLAASGAGGMGEVYKARDTRLDRIVAIKVLPAHFASSADLRERFEREAKAIAALAHPHICTLHDVGRQDETDFLVMEFLEGETLAERLEKGAVPLEEALQIAIQVAGALATAHGAGIVHRDLKPANIMLTKSGAVRPGSPQAKLLDFGLAKTATPANTGGLSMLPTTPPGLTVQGTILGTFQYMAPEQLEGQEADARTDIFAFGAVVYETLTGTKAFEGKSQASLIGAILRDTPLPISTRLPIVPASLDRIIAMCLAKDPADRWQAARDVLVQLQWVVQHEASAPAGTPAPRRRREALAWIVAAIALVAGVAGVTTRYLESDPPGPGAVRFNVDVSRSGDVGFFAVAPDGRRLAYVAPSKFNIRSLWVRSFESGETQQLTGTEGSNRPFWSPDSRSLGFYADGKLKIVDLSGRSPRTVSDVEDAGWATWSRNGDILFGSNRSGVRVSNRGGRPVAVTAAVGLAHFLPDGRHFLGVGGDDTRRGLYVGELGSSDMRLVEEGLVSNLAYVPPGYLLFASSGRLMARPFDASRLAATGDAVDLGDVRQGNGGWASFSASDTGILAFQPPMETEVQLVWVTRGGRPAGNFFTPRRAIHVFSLSSDDSRALTEESRDIWMLDSTRGTEQRLVSGSEFDAHPVWSRDDSRIAFSSGPLTAANTLMIKSATGVEEARSIVQSPNTKWTTDWSPDGKTLVFEERDPETGWDIETVSVDGDGKPRPIVHSRFQERMGSVSPDGRFMAYVSDDTGRPEVYVVPFPDASNKWPVSTGGGTAPKWSHDGRELFFVGSGDMLMSVPVTQGKTIEFGRQTPLFELGALVNDGWTYAVSRDGQRFLVARPVETAATPITVVVNWTDLLKR